MSLTRLENFLRSVKGSTIYVNSDSLDSTDSIENTGSSLTRPFKTIQRALIEAVRYSYRAGLDNDRFGKTTIIVYPGEYDIDNRPGVLIKDDGSLLYRNSLTASLPEWNLSSNFDIYNPNNELYKLNSIHGGVFIPRGATLWAYDLRKTIIRPLYVPSPTNNSIEESSVFRLTGASLPERFTFLDSNPNGSCYKDYTSNKFAPIFSHHKLHCYLNADGVNDVVVNDDFLNVTTTRTDLEMYYEKISLVYGESSGREIQDVIYSPNLSLDLEPIIDEIRIVGSKGKEAGITTIRSGNGVTPSTTITVFLSEELTDVSVDTPIQISGVGQAGYDGQFVVYNVISSSQLEYKTSIVPTVASPSTVGSTLNIVVDSVTSASPYIKTNTLRSVYGMCGYKADGNVVSGFKSAVVSEFTGISVQKDDNAFVKYDSVSGTYRDSTTVPNLHKDPRARYKPEYEHYHLKFVNNAFGEVVSSFAIGMANQYVVESGGDITITASKSDFGAKALVSDGFKKEAFTQDDQGYFVGFVPPKIVGNNTFNVEFYSVDVGLTTSVANNTRLYISEAKNIDSSPIHLVDGYRFGANSNEILGVELSNGTTVGIYTAKVLQPNSATSSEKSYTVARINNNTENSITNNTFNLNSVHNIVTGEKIRVVSENGHLPDGLISHRVGYAITTGLPATRIKIAETFNNALSNNAITINRKGGNLSIVSRVSDKLPGEAGHPIQWDSTNNNWYVNVDSTNSVYSQLNTLGVSVLGSSTPRSFISRTTDSRSDEDKIFKIQYVIPSNTNVSGRPPLESYVIQESNDVLLDPTEIGKYFSDSVSTLNNVSELRNYHYISNVTWDSGFATVWTETPHNLSIGTKIESINVIEGEYLVSGIVDDKKFTVPLSTNPGTFNVDTTQRNQNLPYFKKLETANTYQIYKVNEVQEYIYNKQDGVYEFIVVNTSNSPTVSPFQGLKFSQPIESLYPQLDRDNVESDPDSARCFALPDKIGEVVINKEQNSLTKETKYKIDKDFNHGYEVVNIISNSSGIAHTFTTGTTHNLRSITNLSLLTAGSNYIPGTYYAANVLAQEGTGRNANARITVNGSGVVSGLQIMDGGAAYCVGDVANLVPVAGIGTTTGFVPATIIVTSVNDNLNDTFYFNNNTTPFRITAVEDHNKIQVSSATTAVGLDNGDITPSGKAISITTFSYSPTTGIATAICSGSHGFQVNETTILGGFDSEFYNKQVLIKQVPDITSIIVDLGKNTTSPVTTGTPFVYPTLTANHGKVLYPYGGIAATLASQLTAESTSDVLTIANAVSLGLIIGDFVKVDDEVFRIKSDITSNNISVFRAQLGTKKQTHPINSVVRKIKVTPVELRKSSSIRASAHTFESVGFGPGNYSTALPERQTITITTKEKNLAHSFKTNSGVINYSANDENGDLYTTNKKTYAHTGVEEVYESPISNILGDPKTNDLLTSSNVIVNNTIKISGGSEGDLLSEIYGPLVLNNKLTSYSDKGIEAPCFLIQGQESTSRKIGVGSTTPTSGGYGDIIFNSKPKNGGYIGWSYTVDNRWIGFGKIGS